MQISVHLAIIVEGTLLGRDHKFRDVLLTSSIAAGSMYVFNKIYGAHAVNRHKLQALAKNFFNWKGLNVYYETKGSGSPLILLHALHPAASAYEWNLVIDQLSQFHTVYVLDFPGCGRSDKPNTLYTNFYYVQFLRDFIRGLNLQGAVVCASNLTSAVAVSAAVYEPELISRIILVNPPSLRSLAEVPDSLSKGLCRILCLPLIGTFIYNILASRPQIDMYFSEKYFYNPFHDTDDLVDTYFESAHLKDGCGRYFAASMIGKYLNCHLGYVLTKLSVPIKIIEGSSTDNAELVLFEWKQAVSGIETAMIEHTKQLPMLEEPEKTAEEILEFCRGK